LRDVSEPDRYVLNCASRAVHPMNTNLGVRLEFVDIPDQRSAWLNRNKVKPDPYEVQS